MTHFYDRYLDDERLVQFEKLLLKLEGQLFDGLIFQVHPIYTLSCS